MNEKNRCVHLISILKLFSVIILFGFTGSSYSQGTSSQKHSNSRTEDSLKIHEMHKDINDTVRRKLVEKIHLEELNEPTYKSWNTVCPGLGYKVDHKIKPIEYNGKLYGFCCKVCRKNFSENPKKYINNLDKYGGKFIGKK